MSSAVVFLWCFQYILCQSRFQPLPIKSVTLNTSNTIESGATIQTASPSEISIINDTWHIDVANDDTWHILLDLDNTWGFHPIYPSTISITINGVGSGKDFILAFLVDDQYFVVRLNLGNTIWDNYINPTCDTDYPYTAESFLTGDPESIIASSGARACNFDLSQLCGNYNPNYLLPLSRTNSWPLNFTFENHPNEYMVMRYRDQNTQICGFDNGFPTNQGLKLYFASNGWSTSNNIESFDIEYSYNLTYNPTINPTVFPSGTNM